MVAWLAWVEGDRVGGGTAPLNKRRRLQRYHPVSERYGFMPAHAQRSRGWFELRMTPVTASRLATILGKLPYLEPGERPPAGTTREEWARLKLFLEQTCQIPRGGMQDTGDLMADHIRRGVVGEDLVALLYEMATGELVLEMPSVQHPQLGFVWVSADGLEAGTGRNVEIKMPARLKEFFCGEVWERVVWACGGFLGGSPCEGYHDRDTCAHRVVQQVCDAEWPCPKCIVLCMSIYEDQVSGQADSLDCPGSVFIQLRSFEAIQEILRIPGCRDREAGLDFGRIMDRVRLLPPGELILPAGKKPGDYLKIVYPDRDYSWRGRVAPTLWQYHCKVLEERERRGVTFESYAAYHGMKFE